MLSILCELITPILLLGLLALPWLHKCRVGRRAFVFVLFLELSLGLTVTYSLMALDILWNLWPRFSLDYSTHTAFALSLCLPLLKHQHWAWGGVLLVYGLLMHALGYHSWADMVSTTLSWAMFSLPLIHIARLRLKLMGNY